MLTYWLVASRSSVLPTSVLPTFAFPSLECCVAPPLGHRTFLWRKQAVLFVAISCTSPECGGPRLISALERLRRIAANQASLYYIVSFRQPRAPGHDPTSSNQNKLLQKKCTFLLFINLCSSSWLFHLFVVLQTPTLATEQTVLTTLPRQGTRRRKEVAHQVIMLIPEGFCGQPCSTCQHTGEMGIHPTRIEFRLGDRAMKRVSFHE